MLPSYTRAPSGRRLFVERLEDRRMLIAGVTVIAPIALDELFVELASPVN